MRRSSASMSRRWVPAIGAYAPLAMARWSASSGKAMARSFRVVVRAGGERELLAGLLCILRLLCPCQAQLALYVPVAYASVMAELKDQRIPVMMTRGEVARIDSYRAAQPDLPSRAEAIRRLVDKALSPDPLNGLIR